MDKLYALILQENYSYYEWEDEIEYSNSSHTILGYSTSLKELEYIKEHYDLYADEELFIEEIKKLTKDSFIKEQRSYEYRTIVKLKRKNSYFEIDDIYPQEVIEIFSVHKDTQELDNTIANIEHINKNNLLIEVFMFSEMGNREQIFELEQEKFISNLKILLDNLKSTDVRSSDKVLHEIEKIR